MKSRFYLAFSLLVGLVFVSFVQAQDKPAEFGIKFSGYVNYNAIYDTRESATLREAHTYLYPLPKSLDRNGADVNATSSLNMLAIQSRLSSTITAPDAMGAKITGMLEAEWYGQGNGNENGFRLRHAFAKLSWENTQVLIGQFWNPLFVTDCFPGELGSNTGLPFQPFARNPQIRVTHSVGPVSFLAAVASQRDFTSMGPAVPGNTTGGSYYLRYSSIPDLYLQVHAKADKHLFGVGGEFKTLKPRISTAAGFKSDETVAGYSAMGFARLNLDPVMVKLYGIYGSNLPDYMMLGGYYITDSVAATKTDKYSPSKVYSVWGDVEYGKEFSVGVFAGYSKTLGTDKKIVTPSWSNGVSFYGRGGNIDNLFRVAPRVAYTSGKLKFGLEFEYTAAKYGSVDAQGKVIQTATTPFTNVSNSRVLFATFLFF